MKKFSAALLFSLLAVLLMGAAASTSLVYVDTTSRALTGNIVAGNNTTISASGNGTITATAAPLSGLTGLGTGVGTFLATPSSANLASAVTNETGSGALVFATSPTLVTPVLGAATGTSLSLTGAATSNNAFLVDTNTSFVTHTATAAKLQAQTSWGGVLSGFGTTNDVSLFNKSGGLALSVPTGTTNVGIAGTLLIPDGSTAAPSFTFSADTDTGIARAATNSLEVTAGGVRSALFTSTGQTVSGNLTVSGTGTHTFSGPVAVTSGNYFKTSDIRDGTATADRLVHTSSTTAIFGGGSTWTNTALYAGGVQQLAVNSAATTVAGNLTVSGSGGTTTSDVTLGTSGPSVKSSLGARAPRQGLVFDGTAASYATSTQASTFGTRDFTIAAWVRPEVLADNTQINSGSASNSPSLQLMSGGQIRAVNGGVGQLSITSGSYATAGKWSLIYWKRSGSTNTVGNQTTSETFTDSTNFSAAAGTIIGGSYYNGTVVPLLYNRALSASEVLALYESGAPAASDYQPSFGNPININTPSLFLGSGATGSLTASTTTSYTLDYTGGSTVDYRPAVVYYGTNTVKNGSYWRVKFTTVVNAGSPKFRGYGDSPWTNATGGTVVSGTNPSNQTLAGTQTWDYIVRAGISTTNLPLQFTWDGQNAGGAAWNVSVSSISVEPLGLLLAPDAQQVGGGSVWADTSGNAAHITLPASGVAWNVPSQQGEYVSASVAYNSVSLTSDVGAPVVSLSLTPGDWDVQGNLSYTPAASTTVNGLVAAISTTSGNTGSAGDGTSTINTFTGTTIYSGLPPTLTTPTVRVSVTSTTTVYLNSYHSFGTSTLKAGGFIRARRVR